MTEKVVLSNQNLDALLACPECKTCFVKIVSGTNRCDGCGLVFQKTNSQKYIFNEVCTSSNKAIKTFSPNKAEIKNKNWRFVNYETVNNWVKSLHKDSLIMDLGSGPLTNASLFQGKNVVFVDGTSFDGVNVVTDFSLSLPFTPNTFDAVLCSNVLEHLYDPIIFLQQTYRSLKPGGQALFLIPFVIKLHQAPRDFYRYTSFGLQTMAQKTNFSSCEIIELGGISNIKGALYCCFVNF